MDKLADFIVNHRRKIGLIFLILIIVSIILIPKVTINYDLSKYVPDTAPAKNAMNVVEDEFGMQSIARVMVNNVTLIEAKEYKEKIEQVDGVNMVLWLDDEVDVYQPESFIDENVMNEYYKDNSALFVVMFDEDDYSTLTKEAINKIQDILPKDTNMIGAALDSKSSQDNIKSEIIVIMAMLLPLAIIILLLTTKFWVAPVLFITVILVSIILNLGSNVIFDSVSFLTFSISAALQFAVSMDYSVFMLHQFEIEKKKTDNIEKAMKQALKNGMVAVMSSSMTTIAGFLALAGMSFGLGSDIGYVFSKGIVFSLICVIFLMPYLILRFNKLIEKTEHKEFLPSFKNLGIVTKKFRWLIILISILIIVPSFVAQKENEFQYGVAAFGSGEGTKLYNDEKAIISKFGRSNPIVVLVPNLDYVSEKNMVNELEQIDSISKVQTIANTLPEGVPNSFVDQDLIGKFQNDKYTRIIVYTKTASESELATKTYEEIKQISEKYFNDEYMITGAIPITLDMKNVIESDYNTVNLISIIAIWAILIITFKNIFLATLLVANIEAGIFINMAIPYFTNTPLIFMGYLIVSSITLGATIDYAILVTNNYLNARKDMDKNEAMVNTIVKSVPAIITSAGILIGAGYLIKLGSSINAVSSIGGLIARGALISVIIVILILPQLLVIFDKIIRSSLIPKKLQKKLENRRIKKIEKFKNSIVYKRNLEFLNKKEKIRQEKENIKIDKQKKKISRKIEKLEKKLHEIEGGYSNESK